ncbi:MAG: hypothetical protein ABSE22_06350 [Xanthobacteraceae bacterium]|jgi:hypothetical protein
MTIRGARVLILTMAGVVGLAGCSTATKLGDAVPADRQPVAAAKPPADAAPSPDITGSIATPRPEPAAPPQAAPATPPERPLMDAILPLMFLSAGP